MCSQVGETHIPSDMCSQVGKTNSPKREVKMADLTGFLVSLNRQQKGRREGRLCPGRPGLLRQDLLIKCFSYLAGTPWTSASRFINKMFLISCRDKLRVANEELQKKKTYIESLEPKVSSTSE